MILMDGYVHSQFAKVDSMKKILLLLVLTATAFPAAGVFAANLDHDVYGALLDMHVNERGLVDYGGFKADEAELDAYLDMLSNADVDAMVPDEELAFWINAYNAWTVKLILSEYPDIESIRDIGNFFSGPWDKELVEARGDLYTLDEVEHEIIRPKFGDPRIHFAVNCASIGCPPLRTEPYAGSRLDRQLDEQTVEFVNNPERTRFEDGTLYVNKVFDWYEEDFEPAGGVAAFVRKYARGELRAELEAAGEVDVEYLDYDWSLNEQQ
jgi:hypothetical protein